MNLEENSGRVDVEMKKLELLESCLNPLEFEGESVLQLLVLLRGSLPLHLLFLQVQVALNALKPMERVRLFPLV